MRPITIGGLHIPHPVFLAPMAGVTDHPFRVLARAMGAGVVYTEFVSSDGIIRKIDRTMRLMKFTESERPIGIQIFGHTPEVVGHSAQMLSELYSPDIIDINFGCPVPKVVLRGAGSGALKDFTLMEDITRAVLESVPDKVVTVKMRAGIDREHLVSTEAAVLLEKLGVHAITLHPRTTKQQYTGLADWTLIKEMKDAVSVPVIGNGDIRNPVDARRMLEETGCDGIIIGRGALGFPWIFRDIQLHFSGKSFPAVTVKDRVRMCHRHYDLLKEFHSNIHTLNMTKKHFSWYLKGFPGAVQWRKRFVTSNSTDEVETLLAELNDFCSQYDESHQS